MQVDFHRDGKNSFLYDAVFFFGRHYEGGHFILPYLGYACRGTHGYSVHGAFKILLHGVSHILPTSEAHPPLRISTALYSHGDVYAGIARYAAQLLGEGKFSEDSLWLPFFPKGFNINVFRAVLDKEEKRIRGEHRAYKDNLQVEKGGDKHQRVK